MTYGQKNLFIFAMEYEFIKVYYVLVKNANFDEEKVKPGHRRKRHRIKTVEIENFEIAKSCLGSLRVQRYIVSMS